LLTEAVDVISYRLPPAAHMAFDDTLAAVIVREAGGCAGGVHYPLEAPPHIPKVGAPQRENHVPIGVMRNALSVHLGQGIRLCITSVRIRADIAAEREVPDPVVEGLGHPLGGRSRDQT